MRWLLIGLGVLVATALVVTPLASQPGYVLLAHGSTSIEMSLVLFAVIVVVGFVLVYAGLRTLFRIWQLPRALEQRRLRRHSEIARRKLTRGLIESSEGRWAQAERLLVRSAGRSETPLLNYLAAARAAQMQGAYERRDEYLRRAIESDPEADVAVGLTQAELQLAHRQLEQALATLNHLSEVSPKHDYVLRLLAKVYRRLEDWEAQSRLLPDLRKREVLDAEELLEIEEETVTGLLSRHASRGEFAHIESLWQSLPRSSRERVPLVQAYAQALIRVKEPERAEAVVRAALNRDWDEGLARTYGRIPQLDPSKPLAHAEGWLKEHGRSPMLLLTLGRLCRQARLWGKARIYFESSLGIQPLAECYGELGGLLEQMGDAEHAQECYRKGLRLAVEGVAEPVRHRGAKTKALKAQRPLQHDPDVFSA